MLTFPDHAKISFSEKQWRFANLGERNMLHVTWVNKIEDEVISK